MEEIAKDELTKKINDKIQESEYSLELLKNLDIILNEYKATESS